MVLGEERFRVRLYELAVDRVEYLLAFCEVRAECTVFAVTVGLSGSCLGAATLCQVLVKCLARFHQGDPDVDGSINLGLMILKYALVLTDSREGCD